MVKRWADMSGQERLDWCAELCDDMVVAYCTSWSIVDSSVLSRVTLWGDENQPAYDRFWRCLSEILRSRDPYYRDTEPDQDLCLMAEYRPGDFAHAAWLAMNDKGEA